MSIKLGIGKKICFSFIASILIIISCLIIGEIFTYVYYHFSRFDRPIFVPDTYLAYVHQKTSKFVYTYDEGEKIRISHRTNNHGFMGNENISIEKPDGTTRIIMMGDSFTEALQVNENESFSSQLKRLLNQRLAGSGIDLQLINAGVSGYSPISMYLYYKLKLAQFKPDVVMVQLFANDVYEDNKATVNSVLDKDGLPVKISPYFSKIKLNADQVQKDQRSWKNRFREWIISRSRFVEYMYSKYYRFCKKSAYHKKMMKEQEYEIGHQFFIIYNRNGPLEQEEFRKRVCLQSDRYLLALKNLVEQSGAKFVLYYIPMEAQLARKDYSHHVKVYTTKQFGDYWNRWLARLSQEYGIFWKDLIPAFQKHESEELYLNKDGHLTPRGHILVAHELYDFLLNVLKFDELIINRR